MPTGRYSGPTSARSNCNHRFSTLHGGMATRRLMAEAPAPKRPRQSGAGPELPELSELPELPDFVLCAGNDDCDRFVEVDLRILAQFDCRLYKHIRYDPPLTDANTGRPYWRSGMSKAMLQTFLRSLQHGELSLGKTVGVAEAMTTFEYENVPVGVPVAQAGGVEVLRMPPPGAVFQKRIERISETVLRTSEQIAHAIARWPRLEASLDAALTGFPVQCTCTATRIWVRFVRKPPGVGTSDRQDLGLQLMKRWPPWMQMMLVSFGIIHDRLIKNKLIGAYALDEKSFAALHTAVQGDSLGYFLDTAHDWHRSAMDRKTRRNLYAGETFAASIRATILESTTREHNIPEPQLTTPGGTPLPSTADALSYARACVSLAEELLQYAPSPATMFAGLCSDESGRSPERAQLQRSLMQRGIKVVRWSDEDRGPPRPLVFPPHWEDGRTSGTAGSAGTAGCAVLLDFSDRR